MASPTFDNGLLKKPENVLPVEEKYIFKSASELASIIRNREAASVAIVKEFIGHIKNNNYKYNAIVWFKEKEALDDAKKADEAVAKGGKLSALHGVPITVKEEYWVKGSPVALGSKMYKDFIAPDVYMKLPGGWLSGNGKQQLQFSTLAFDTNTLLSKQMPKIAREYNSPAVVEFSGTGTVYTSFLSTSENIIIQSFQRVNDELEIRFVERYRVKGTAIINLQQKAGVARLTNFIGEGDEFIGEGPTYKIPVRPQQIVRCG